VPRPSQVLRSGTTVAVGVGLGQLLILASSPILSRLFDPDAFGVFGVITSIESILVVTAALRFELAEPLPRSDEDASALVALGTISVVGWTIFSAVVLLLLRSSLASWTSTPEVADVALLIPIVLLFDGLGNVLAYWSIRKARFGQLSASRVAQGAGQVAGQLGLGPARASAGSLIVGYALGKLVNTVWLAFDAWRSQTTRLARVSWSAVRRQASRYRRFPLVSSWSALANSGGLQLPAILMAALFAPEAAGWFLLANRVVVGPATIFGQASAQAFHGEVAQLTHGERQPLRPAVQGLCRQLTFLGLLPTVVLVCFGPPLFELVFGSQWHEAGQYLRLLAPAYFAQFIVSPLAPVLVVLERQGVQAAWDVIRLVAVIASLALPAAFGWSALDAIGVFAVATLATYVGLGVMIFVVVGRFDRSGTSVADLGEGGIDLEPA
jgi:O-antigen/teichoic acid export membrane protein